jgi:CobQ-like glutamine amidotransferase family enzyme
MNKIKLGHLYPRHLNLYGDLGNIICLSARAHWRDLDFEIENIEPDANADLSQFNILFIGGGQDEQQSLIANDFFKYKNQLEAGLARGQCLIAVCGGYQLLGKTYETSEGRKIAGLGIFDIETRAALRQANEKQNRLVGNVVADLNLQLKQPQANLKTLVGFENHAGRTFILPNSDTKSLAEIKKGSGNNA